MSKGKKCNADSRPTKTNRPNNGKPRRPRFHPNRVPGSDRPGRNDLSWWAKNPELLASAARIPFTKRPGTNLEEQDYGFPVTSLVDKATLRTTVPGVMSIWYNYTIGMSRDVTSAASITAKELFARIRSAFSGSLDEDAPDLFMYVMALDQIHAYIAWLKRMYRTINAYSSDNYYYPEAVFAAQLANTDGAFSNASAIYNELRRDKVAFWNLINTLVNMVNKFNCPKNMDIFERHRWMNEHVYSDIDEIRGQVYVFAPTGFFYVDEMGPQGTELAYMEVRDFDWQEGALNALSKAGYAMLSRLSNWEDAYTINGHIQRAFEGTEFYGAASLAQDEQLAPVFNEEVMLQIHNLTVVDDFRQDRIRQNPTDNSILYEPIWALSNTGVQIDLQGATPTSEAIVLATRLCAAGKPGNLTCCTEVVSRIRLCVPKHIYAIVPDKPYEWGFVDLPTNMFLGFPMMSNLPTSNDAILGWYGSLVRQLKMLAYAQAWRFAPRMYVRAAMCNWNEHPSWEPADQTEESLLSRTPTVWGAGEVDNLATADFDDISDLHRVCLYSVFNCFNK